MMTFFRRPEKDYKISGPQGGIATALTLPEGFDIEKDRCPLVVLMHGFMARKELYPLPAIADALAREGIASLRFDFDAHGKSEGAFVNMTVSNELADARAAVQYAAGLPFVESIALLGHSQGGVVAGMLAGQLEDSPLRPKCLVLMAPAAVLKDDALAGQCMNAKYDPKNPPQHVNVFFHKLGRAFILEAQKLPIFETSGKYSGPVCLIHGKKDKIVPVTYSSKYKEGYRDCELHLLENEGHMLKSDKRSVVRIAVSFLKGRLL